MEHLDGVPLNQVLRTMQRLPEGKGLDILIQVCEGLAYAHGQGIIHHDIKPANLFIQPENRVKIVDFGLACAPGTTDSDWSGTVDYMSPEQIEGDPVDERTDIYSVGITAFEMLTGKTPFAGENIAGTLESHLEEDLPDPKDFVPDLSEEFCRVIARAARRDPEERYQDVCQMLADLKPLSEKMGLNSRTRLEEKGKMMTLFLFYRDEHQLDLNRLVEDFSKEVKAMGAVLRAADFKDV
jgi:serine/threonine protein kinase